MAICHHRAAAMSRPAAPETVGGARVDRLLLGLFAIAVGALIAGYGARGFFLLLPLFGFVVGYLVGAQVVANLFGDGVFATLTSWVAGLVVALVFALLAGLWWWAADRDPVRCRGLRARLWPAGGDRVQRPRPAALRRRARGRHRAGGGRARPRRPDTARGRRQRVRRRRLRCRRAVPDPEPDHGRPAQGRPDRRAQRQASRAHPLGRHGRGRVRDPVRRHPPGRVRDHRARPLPTSG